MELTKLIINGFKSFADKTEIDFVSGLTGIVGPNGSGKSNITEAIRWAMGEQSAKSLRGERMGDVIFAGTDHRPPLNRAEVTMVFNNEDGYLKNQPANVTVTRRLFRDGTSAFLLNNQDVRLKDIIDLFMDSGLGRESFSFISQGRVEAIFNSKPEDRRAIIEEAAGVYKYKQQKQKAEKELAENDDNLARINDIIVELKHQVEPLAQQASVAKDYQVQTAAYQKIHQQVLALEIRQLVTEQDQAKADQKMTQATITALGEKIKHLEARSEQLSQADQAFETQQNQLSDRILSQSMKLENLTGAANLSSERAENAKNNLSDLKARLAKAQKDLTEAEAHLKRLTAQAADLAAQKQALQAQYDALQPQALDPVTLNRALEQRQNDYIERLKAQADNKNALAALQKDQQVAASQNAAHDRRVYEMTKQVQAAKTQQTTLQATYTEFRAQHQAHQDAVMAATETLQQLQQQHETMTTQYQTIVADYQRQKARYDTLAELNDDYAGFYGGVRMVLKQKAQLKGVVGAVAELLDVPDDLQPAFDVALGGNMQAIITEDEQAAQRAISLLKQNRAGRATFLPQNVMQPRQLPAGIAASLPNMTGFLGTALSLATYPASVASVMGYLLGTILMVDTLPHAISIANGTHHRYRIVTKEGDVLNPGGSLTGGQGKNQQHASPLARNQTARTLKHSLQQLVPQIEAQRQQLAELVGAINKAQVRREKRQQEMATIAAQLNASRSDMEAQAKVISQLERSLEALQKQQAGQEDLQTRLEALTATGKALAQQLEKDQQQIEALKRQLQEASASQENRQAKQSQLQTQLAVIENDLATNRTQQKQWRSQVATLTKQVDELQTRIEQIANDAKESAADKASRQETIQTLTAAIASDKTKQTAVAKEKADNRAKMSDVSAQITTAYAQQHEAMDRAQQQAVTLNRTKLGLEQRLTTLADEYQITYEAALKTVAKDDDQIPLLRSHLKLLKRGIDELGPVNLGAIAQYEEVNTRYDFLSQQQDDLLAAKSQLTATMSELDQTVKTKFKTMFDQANAAFEAIFPQMFGGGHAHLSLTDPDDLLKTGIEIAAQPPGKKLTRLSLLSGGERALTAIVLLFAILQVRPVPFSILDEVEASLDDVNVTRFGEFLRHYATDTQFIVITHRQGTMVAADVLYGVTMQESGVSRIMAVNLAQTQKKEVQQ